MSDRRVEDPFDQPLDDSLESDSAFSPLGPHVRPTGRRANPEEAAASSSLRSGGGLRTRPHGVRDTPPAAPALPTAGPRPASHPLSRRGPQARRAPRVGLPTLHRPQLHRPSWPLSIRQTLSLAIGLVTVTAVVAGLVLVIPSKPIQTPETGSVRGLEFRAAQHPPTGTFNFGPYFVDHVDRLYMMGSDGTTSAVWSTTDGSTWQAASDAGSFGSAGARFVVHGFADDGNGGCFDQAKEHQAELGH
jgi:hypothetical protein